LLHRFEPADHRFDTGSHLFIFLQKIGTLRSENVLTLLERLVFILQLVANVDERINTLFESLELVLKSYIYVVGHMINIDTRSGRINAYAR